MDGSQLSPRARLAAARSQDELFRQVSAEQQVEGGGGGKGDEGEGEAEAEAEGEGEGESARSENAKARVSSVVARAREYEPGSDFSTSYSCGCLLLASSTETP